MTREKRNVFSQGERREGFQASSTLHAWFEQQVAASPEALAVTCDGEHLSYSQLNGRANQIAHRLRELGVGPEVLVGLFVERSVGAVAAILGILKAGGAYLPLDTVYPKDRLSFMLSDADAPVIVTQSSLIASLPENNASIISLDTDADSLSLHPDCNLESFSNPDNLAYVIYTSGSTGKPKGVMITHHNVVRLMIATEGWYQFGAVDVWTCFHSFAFDFSVWEIWGALLYGGRVVVVPYTVSRSPEEYYQLLVREGVTVLNQTPSAFKQLMLLEEKTGVSKDLSLRYIIFGGEALELSSLKEWFGRHEHDRPRLINMYGITETTVHVTYRPIAATDLGSGSVIGVPIPDLRFYILDEHFRPVPVGSAGEIYVGGAGVARGYLNRPELTAERFLADPIDGRPGARMYRTGDRARSLSNSDIEYLGRADDQVKIRGFRIELGEIENILRMHPLVRDAVVVARSQGNDKQLAAFLTARTGQIPSNNDLRQFLKEELAEYMVPAFYRFIEKIPLTPNGKADRAELLQMISLTTSTANGYQPPASALEETIAKIWQEALGTDRVSREDNFFEVGGSSLMILQVQQRLQDALQVELPVSTLFQFSTVNTLARHLSGESGEDAKVQSEVTSRAARQREAAARRRPAGRGLSSR